MVDRNYIRCTTCGNKVLIRTALGHGNYQEFAFPCPNCGVEIRYGMDLDQNAPSWQYTKLINGEWFNPEFEHEREPDSIPTFDPESLIPLDLGDFFSPFIRISFLPVDVELFHKDRSLRIMLCHEVWPVIKRCKTHFDNNDWSYYEKAAVEIDPDFKNSTQKHNVAHFLRILHRFNEKFLPYYGSKSRMIRQRINLACSTNAASCEDIRNYIRSVGWIDSLYKELFSLKDRWATDIYHIIQPLYLTLYWDRSKHSISDYTLSQKRFDDLKPFYIDCFETLARVSLVAGAFEGVIHQNRAEIPKGNKNVQLEQFRAQDNGTKYDLIKNLVIGDIFQPLQENRLRNGIGHHSTHYDVKSDTIEYRNEGRRGITQYTISYIEFCQKLMHLYHSIELSSLYTHWLLAKEHGLKGRVV